MQEINDKNILLDERTDKFLRNQMTAEEEQNFLSEMEADKEMKSYVTTTVLLIDGIRKQEKQKDEAIINAAKKASEKEIYSAAGKEVPTSKKIGQLLQMNRWISSAVAVAAVFVCVFILNNALVNNGAMDSFNGISAQESVMRGEDNAELKSNLARIYNNVDSKQYIASSIVSLEELYQKATDDITDDEDDYSHDIGLYLAKAYVLNNQKEDAKRILNEMHEIYPKDVQISELLHHLTKTFFWE